ncbi:MAG: mechanosensitive ion channel family protein [archaeon]
MSQFTPFPLQFSDTIENTIAEVIEFLPTLIGALLILVVGYVVGRILGGIVTRIVRRIGIDRYAEGTAVEEVGTGDSIALALGKIVAFYVYFVAIIAAVDLLDIDLLTELLTDIGEFVPLVLAALIVLVVGFIVARILGDIVAGVVGGFGIGPLLRGTPLERFGDQEGEFGRLVGKLLTYYVYLLTLLAVADILQIQEFSSFMQALVGYIPALIGGLVVLLVGIWVAERAASLVRESDDSRMIGLAAVVVKVFIYYIAITIALGTIEFDISPLTDLFTAFVVAFFGALALALAIGIGVAVGLGGQDYVAQNVDDWVSSVRRTAEVNESSESE